MHIELDPVGGVAGDMFIAAVLDAFPDLEAGMLVAVRAAGLPEPALCRLLPHSDQVLTGKRFLVENLEALESPVQRHGLTPKAPHHHAHTPFREIRAQLLDSALDRPVALRAVAIFALLAEVEARVHGATPEEVSFHELGGWDSIADMVGAAYLIESLGATWTVSALPRGSGRVHTAHGWLAVPPPATALLLEGFQIIDDGIAGERVTPTGAAILRHLGANRPGARRARRLHCGGTGFGTRTLPGLSNVLRLLAFQEEDLPGRDHVGVISFEVDDQAPEDLASGVERLRARDDVLDVLQMPAYGKKGRLTVHLQVLCRAGQAEAVVRACFEQTTTLGVRLQEVERRLLAREAGIVAVEGQPLRVKYAERPGGRTAKVESDDIAEAPDQAARSRLRRQVQSMPGEPGEEASA